MNRTTEERLRIGFILDHRWFGMKFNQGDRSKEETLLLLTETSIEERIPYAIIGGVDLQVHTSDPRTTFDIDVAVPDRADVTEAALKARGLEHAGTYG